MLKLDILKLLYKGSPMNFYNEQAGKTIIKSINNTSLGYCFDKTFSQEDIKRIWKGIKIHKRISTILIFIAFIVLLYQTVFPKFSILVNNNWYVNALILFILFAIVCQIITYICTKLFESGLKKRFGNFTKTKFESPKNIDKDYFILFEMELIKVLVLVVVLISAFAFVSPFDCTKKLLDKGHYNQVIKITTLGAKVFPIAQEWYVMRGYANYKLKNYQNAIYDFDKAYQLGADGFNIMNFDNKIFIKYQLKDYQGALADFDKEIANAGSENEKDQFLWDKAQFLYNISEYEKALELYTELIEKAETDKIFLLKDRLYIERAQVYKKLGNLEQAKLDEETAGALEDEVNGEIIPKPVLMLDDETFEN